MASRESGAAGIALEPHARRELRDFAHDVAVGLPAERSVIIHFCTPRERQGDWDELAPIAWRRLGEALSERLKNAT